MVGIDYVHLTILARASRVSLHENLPIIFRGLFSVLLKLGGISFVDKLIDLLISGIPFTRPLRLNEHRIAPFSTRSYKCFIAAVVTYYGDKLFKESLCSSLELMALADFTVTNMLTRSYMCVGHNAAVACVKTGFLTGYYSSIDSSENFFPDDSYHTVMIMNGSRKLHTSGARYKRVIPICVAGYDLAHLRESDNYKEFTYWVTCSFMDWIFYQCFIDSCPSSCYDILCDGTQYVLHYPFNRQLKRRLCWSGLLLRCGLMRQDPARVTTLDDHLDSDLNFTIDMIL